MCIYILLYVASEVEMLDVILTSITDISIILANLVWASGKCSVSPPALTWLITWPLSTAIIIICLLDIQRIQSVNDRLT